MVGRTGLIVVDVRLFRPSIDVTVSAASFSRKEWKSELTSNALLLFAALQSYLAHVYSLVKFLFAIGGTVGIAWDSHVLGSLSKISGTKVLPTSLRHEVYVAYWDTPKHHEKQDLQTSSFRAALWLRHSR